MSLVAGADGCKAGWTLVLARIAAGPRLELLEVTVVDGFVPLLQRTSACEAVAVDIPIGLSEDGRREADFAARRLLGPRRSSVFPAPPRCLLTAMGGYEVLNALCRARTGRGISQQTCNLLDKIREADALVTPAMQSRVVESHPEVVFRALSGAPLSAAKREPAGRAERLALLERIYSETIGQCRPPKGAAGDDLYDALVLAWTASRVAQGEARHLPEQAQLDARGLRMEIVY